jgi:hypothetical protein
VTAIGRLLHDAYGLGPTEVQSAGSDRFVAEVERILAIYGEGMRVDAVEIVANDHLGLVLTRESKGAGKAVKIWRGIHAWSFREGRCTQFEAYVQALVVAPPRSESDL